MNPHVAQKLFKILTDAGLAQELAGVDLREFLHRQAYRHYGETKRVLLQISYLDDIETFLSTFIQEMNS